MQDHACNKAGRHTSAVCIAAHLKLAVPVFVLRAVNTTIPASNRISELLAGQLFDRLHVPAAKRTEPTYYRGRLVFGGTKTG
jgi:hypothetical protein